MRKIGTLLLVFFHIGLAWAQTSILKGRITDAQTGEPLAFATVQMSVPPGGTLSDTTGSFSLQIPESIEKVKVSVSLVGYIRQSIFLSVSEKAADIRLAPDESNLKEVVVTGTMKEMRKSDSPVPVEVFSPKFFLRNPTPSLFDAIQMVNGVRPQLQCNVCNTGDIHINGMEGPYTMVLIDGMPIVSGLSTVYGLSGIPNSVLQRMEVVKGPAASLYGSEAMGGLINIITKDPADKPEIRLDLNGTTYGEYNADAAGSLTLGNAKTLLSANYFHFSERWDINDDNFTDVTLQKRLSIFNKWRFERKDNRIASVAFRYLWEDRYGGEMQWEPRWRGTDSIYGESILTNRYEIIGNYQLPIENQKVLFSFSYNRHHQDSYYGDVPYLADQRIGFGQLTWERHLWQRHDVLFGTGARYTFYDDNTPVTANNNLENAPQRVWLPGVFVQDEWTFNKRWKLLSGLRWDHDKRHGNILSPRLNLKYDPDSENTLRLSAGSGFRVVNVFSEDHAALTGGRQVVFAEELEPERTWNANLNYTRFQNTGFGFINFDATVFYTYFFNKIIADYDADPEKIIYQNLDGYAENMGFSLNSDWNFTNGLKAMAGFTLMDVSVVESGRRAWQIHTPHFTGNWSLSYPITKWNLTLDYNGHLTSSMRLPVFPNDYRPEQSPWFSIHNIQVTWKLKSRGSSDLTTFEKLSNLAGGMEIYAGVKNLFNFYPREDVILRPHDPFDKQADNPVDNPNGYTFDPSYNYAPVQAVRGFAGVRVAIK
ncbi:MAG: Vitamin B12 transporter BtuB [Saprospiraceae bacterium]|nr:Vitamin B12 transporter BtuB [Saprospiraceae bacterium]